MDFTVVAFAAEIWLTSGVVCSSSCAQEFTSGCVPHHGGGCVGYNRCREELNGNAGPLFTRGSCTSACDDTVEMRNVCSNGSPNSPHQPHPSSEPAEKPSTPSPCSSQNQGRCKCATLQGFTTYTWWIGAVPAQQQRCFTTYVPFNVSRPMPVILHNQCYARDALNGISMTAGSKLVQAATRFGFAAFGLSSPDGNWEFGNNGIVNDAVPTPCAASDSKDIQYLQGVLDFIGSASSIFAHNAVFTEGFSQNSMFAAYAGVCFRDKIAGIWQGGSGLALKGKAPFPPGMQAQCSATSFAQHKAACTSVDPCAECKYWPIYPTPSSPPMRDCIMSYTDDFLHGSSKPMYEAMTENGHDARLFAFAPASGVRGGHSSMANVYSWVVGCLGIISNCSTECEAIFKDCMSGTIQGTAAAVGAFNSCLDTAFATGACDQKPCAPTLEMLKTSETPESFLLGRGVFGAGGATLPQGGGATSLASGGIARHGHVLLTMLATTTLHCLQRL